jgi:hypothetical protein
MNPKLQKVEKDIERTRAKIVELQGLLPDLERQRTELENLEIVRTVRGASIAPGDLAEFIAAYHAGLNRQNPPPQALIPPLPSQPAPARNNAAASREEGGLDDDSE